MRREERLRDDALLLAYRDLVNRRRRAHHRYAPLLSRRQLRLAWRALAPAEREERRVRMRAEIEEAVT